MSDDDYDLKELERRVAGYSYRVDNSGTYGLDSHSDEYEVDEGEMSLVLPFADGQRRDGVGDLLEISGIDVSRHRGNPISLFDHGKAVTLPIGLFSDPNTNEYTVQLDPIAKTAKGKVFIYQGSGIPNAKKEQEYPHAVFCQQIFDLWVKKFIRAGSIGYQVIDGRQLQPDYERGTQAGLHLIKILMLEGSVVVMPANQDTVRKSYSEVAREILAMPAVCGKSLSPFLVKSLQPYVQNYNKTVVGLVKTGCMNCNAPLAGVTHNVFGKELCSGCYVKDLESSIKAIPTERKAEIETVKVPLNEDLTKTDIPPVDWKPGLGAKKDLEKEDEKCGKDLCPNNAKITLSDDYGCPSAFESQRKGLRSCKSCGKSLQSVQYLVKELPEEEIDSYEKALVGSLKKGLGIIYRSKAAIVDDIGDVEDGKIKVILTDGRKFVADPNDYVKKFSDVKKEKGAAKFEIGDTVGVRGGEDGQIVNRAQGANGWVYVVQFVSGGSYNAREDEIKAKSLDLDALDESDDDVQQTNQTDEKDIDFWGDIPKGKSMKSIRSKYKFMRQNSKGFDDDARQFHHAFTKIGYGLGRPIVNGSTLIYQTPDPEDAEMLIEDIPAIGRQAGVTATAISKGRELHVTIKSLSGSKSLKQSILSLINESISDWKEDDSKITFRVDPEESRKVAQIISRNREKLGIDDANPFGEVVTIYKSLGNIGEKLMRPDEVIAGGFPQFVTDADDRYKLESAAPNELRTWREAVAKHNSLASTSAKLRHRRELEDAFRDLKRAYDKMKREKSFKSIRSKYKGMGFLVPLSMAPGSWRVGNKYGQELKSSPLFKSREEAQKWIDEHPEVEKDARSRPLGSKGFPGEIRSYAENVAVGDKLSIFSSQHTVRKVRRNSEDPSQIEFELDNGEMVYRRTGDPVYMTMRGKSLNNLRKVDEYKGYLLKYDKEQEIWYIFDPKGNNLGSTDKQYWKVLVDDNLKSENKKSIKGWKSWSSQSDISDAMWRAVQEDWDNLPEAEKTRIKKEKKEALDKEMKKQAEEKERKRKEKEKEEKDRLKEIEKKFKETVKKDKSTAESMKSEATRMLDRFKSKYPVFDGYSLEVVNVTDMGDDYSTYQTWGLQIVLEFNDWVNNKKVMKMTFKASEDRRLHDDLNYIENSLRTYAQKTKSMNGWKSLKVPFKSKALCNIRHKYRTTKGLVRRLRKSASGSSMIYVRSKDLDELEKEAIGKDLTINRMGSHSKGIEKVKLSGNDGSIDALAKKFGRSSKWKSLNRKAKSVNYEIVSAFRKAGKWSMDKLEGIIEQLRNMNPADVLHTWEAMGFPANNRWTANELKRHIANTIRKEHNVQTMGYAYGSLKKKAKN